MDLGYSTIGWGHTLTVGDVSNPLDSASRLRDRMRHWERVLSGRDRRAAMRLYQGRMEMLSKANARTAEQVCEVCETEDDFGDYLVWGVMEAVYGKWRFDGYSPAHSARNERARLRAITGVPAVGQWLGRVGPRELGRDGVVLWAAEATGRMTAIIGQKISDVVGGGDGTYDNERRDTFEFYEWMSSTCSFVVPEGRDTSDRRICGVIADGSEYVIVVEPEVTKSAVDRIVEFGYHVVPMLYDGYLNQKVKTRLRILRGFQRELVSDASTVREASRTIEHLTEEEKVRFVVAHDVRRISWLARL